LKFEIDFEEIEVLGFGPLGKMLILLGVFIILIGFLLVIGEKIPWIGRLPGDIIIRKRTSLLLSHCYLHPHQYHPDPVVYAVPEVVLLKESLTKFSDSVFNDRHSIRRQGCMRVGMGI